MQEKHVFFYQFYVDSNFKHIPPKDTSTVSLPCIHESPDVAMHSSLRLQSACHQEKLVKIENTYVYIWVFP